MRRGDYDVAEPPERLRGVALRAGAEPLDAGPLDAGPFDAAATDFDAGVGSGTDVGATVAPGFSSFSRRNDS